MPYQPPNLGADRQAGWQAPLRGCRPGLRWVAGSRLLALLPVEEGIGITAEMSADGDHGDDSLGLLGKLAVTSDGLGNLGDGVVKVHGWYPSFPPLRIQALSSVGRM